MRGRTGLLSAFHIPVPVVGSCSHPCGTPLISLYLSIPEVFLISFISLLFQAFYGHGGFTTLAANTLALAFPCLIISPISKYVMGIGKRKTLTFLILFLIGFLF